MLKRLGHALVIVALVTALGGHWAVLQTVAWTTMLANNLKGNSFSEAVQRTFDGKHPCTMCKQISAGKQTEKKTEFTGSIKKFEFTSERTVVVLTPPQSFYLQADWHVAHSDLDQQPPSPPPRHLSA